MDKNILAKINFRQGKYMLPAMLYFPILLIGWGICSAFDGGDQPKSKLRTTQYLNSDLPDAAVDSTLGDKMDNVDKMYGGITDVTGVSNAESDADSANKKEDYQSQYSDSEARAVAQQEQNRADLAAAQMAEREHNAKLREMQDRIRSTAYRKRAGRTYDDGFVDPASDNAIAEAQRRRREREMEEINRNLVASGARSRARYNNYYNNGSYNQGQNMNGTGQYADNGYNGYNNGNNGYNNGMGNGSASGNYGANVSYGNGSSGNGGYGSSSDANSNEPQTVVKKEKDMSDYFNTVGGNNHRKKGLITAIIDENIKAVDGSRVRLRLLDDIVINGETIKKGTYLYAHLGSFGKQRVQGSVSSIFANGEIIKVSLTIYDTDGLAGLYVPQSEFKESARDIAGSATESSNNLTGDTYGGTGIKGWASQAAQNATTKVMNTISKVIKKNRVRLKYGTKVYLIDSSAQERANERKQQEQQQQARRRAFNTAASSGYYDRDAYSGYEY